MPQTNLSNFNIVNATLGGYIALFCLVSYLFKERLYLSETRMAQAPKSLSRIKLTACSHLYHRRCHIRTVFDKSRAPT